MKIMFLGGSLDHATRDVEVDDTGTPKKETICVIRPARPPYPLADVEPDPPRETYKRWTVKADPVMWHLYVLAGHQPSRRSLLDAKI